MSIHIQDKARSNGLTLSEIKKVHLIGVGGIGMSALARLFLSEKKEVSGSDRTPSEITHALEHEGMHFFATQVGENITDTIDLVVYTEAMSPDHEELVRAREKGIETINYFDALGMIANEYYLIAVAGSHGKTTTTAMLIDIFEHAGFDPSAVVGSLRAQTKSNYRAGKSKYFIVEACEYKRDFLSLRPDVLVITNIEYEHVDYYTSLKDVQSAFQEFAHQVREGGVVIVNFDGENIAPVLEGVTVSVVDYGKYFSPLRTLLVPGVHNQMNAAAAAAVAAHVGVPSSETEEALSKFSGTWRRFEYKGEVQGAKVYDDYGHHPTEIEATLKGAREMYPDKKLTLIFQSHTYTRTQTLFENFVRVLALPDHTLILPIYAAREVNGTGISHTKLAEAAAVLNPRVEARDSFDEVVEEIKAGVGKDDLVLVMGAGTITEVATKLVS